MERLIKKGAEADIYISSWFGRRIIRKVRERKVYRQIELDSSLRKRRTLNESAFIVNARNSGVRTPLLFFVDLKNAEIFMQYISGTRLKELITLNRHNQNDEIYLEVGKCIAKLHNCNIIHGDLTTSNFIITKKGDVVIIDFGLAFYSNKIEDKAVDLHLLDEVFKSAHSQFAERCFNKIIEGYSSVIQNDIGTKIFDKIREIEKRGRYSRVE